MNDARDTVQLWMASGREWPQPSMGGRPAPRPVPAAEPEPASAAICRHTGLRAGDRVRVWPFDDEPATVRGTELEPGPGIVWVLLTDGSAHEAKTGTKGIKLVFEVAEGEHAGRKVFHDLWLTEAAKPQTKRDLDELGITDPERQLDGPIPQGIVVALTVTVQKDKDGIEQNRVRRIKLLRIAPGDAFAPKDDDQDAAIKPASLPKASATRRSDSERAAAASGL